MVGRKRAFVENQRRFARSVDKPYDTDVIPPIQDVAISAGIWLAWPACDVGTRRALWDGVGNDGRTDKEMLAARTMNMVKSATTIEAAVAAMEVAGSKVRAAEYFHKRQEASKSTVEKAWRAFFAAEDKVKSLSVRA